MLPSLRSVLFSLFALKGAYQPEHTGLLCYDAGNILLMDALLDGMQDSGLIA